MSKIISNIARLRPHPFSTSPTSVAKRLRTLLPLQATLQDIPGDIAENIIRHLSIHDIHALRLAGMGSICPTWNTTLRDNLRIRIDKLYPLFVCAQRMGYFPFLTLFNNPVSFASVSHLALFDLDTSSFDVIVRDLPYITSLRILNRDVFTWTSRRLSKLPSDLARLTNLTDVDISDHDFCQVPNVLLQLPRLTVLDLHDNPYLKGIPATFGRLLPNLGRIVLNGCDVRSLPGPLLKRLEMNHDGCSEFCRLGIWGYKGECFSPRKYPKLSMCVTKHIED